MNPLILTYTLYLCLALPLTIWVGKTLHKNGRIFLVQCFNDDENLADSVNHLLLVGFYLLNFGFVVLYLKVGTIVESTQQVFEALSTKMGIVLLILGGMHFFNIYLFARIRRKHMLETAPPPVPPTQIIG